MNKAAKALERAIAICDGITNFARLLGLKSHMTAHQWRWTRRNPRAQVPAEYCPDIERITRERGSPVLCEHLRPDVDWPVVRSNPAPSQERVSA